MARQASFALLENAGGTTGSAFTWPGGILSFSASGSTVADVQLQLKDANGAWNPIAALAHTAAGALVEVVAAGQIRAVDVGGTAVYAYATRVTT